MKNLLYLFFISFLFSCNGISEKKIVINKEKKRLPSIIKKYYKITPIKPTFKKKINEWKEYQNLNEFIKQFTNSTANESLNNAFELKDLIKNIKDSVKPKILETSTLNTRINILYNESLRLVDMSKISAIKTKEVNIEVNKILSTYSSLNKKINTIFSQKKFEELVIIDKSYIGLDTTKIDNISKKNIFLFKKKDSISFKMNKKKHNL